MKNVFWIIPLFLISCESGNQNRKKDTLINGMTKEEWKANYVDSVKKKINSEITEKNIFAAKESPVRLVKSSLSFNSIGIPEANVTFKNESNKTVDAIKVSIPCYNNFNEPVNGGLYGNEFNGISQKKIKPGNSATFTWTMNLFETTTKIKPYVFHVHYSDGSEWKSN